jgi:hypothetical protein
MDNEDTNFIYFVALVTRGLVLHAVRTEHQHYPRGRRLVLYYDAEGDFDRNFDWWKESGKHRKAADQGRHSRREWPSMSEALQISGLAGRSGAARGQ